MNEEKKKETPTLAPPPGQTEDVYSASTVVGQAPKEILDLIARTAEARAETAPDTAPPPGPPKVLIKTPPAVPVTDFSMPEAKTAPAAVVPEMLSSSGLIDDDDWILPEEDAKPPPPPRAAPTPVMPSAPKMQIAELAAPIPASPASAPEAPPAPASQPLQPIQPIQRPATPRTAFAPATPASQPRPRIPTPRADFAPVSVAPVVGAVLGLVDAPMGIPEERASAAKLVAAAPDPNVRVSRVDEEIFSVRNPPTEEAAAADNVAGTGPTSAVPGSGGAGPMRERFHTPQLGDPQLPPSSGMGAGANPNHLPIAEAPNSMHVPIGEAKQLPSRTPVGAIIAVLVVLVLGALGAIVFFVLKK